LPLASADQGELVGLAREVRHHVREADARKRGLQRAERAADFFRRVRLRVETLELRDPAHQEQHDDRLRLRGTRRGGGTSREQRRGDAEAADTEQVAAGEERDGHGGIVGSARGSGEIIASPGTDHKAVESWYAGDLPRPQRDVAGAARSSRGGASG
jgi:hypothetical protein